MSVHIRHTHGYENAIHAIEPSIIKDCMELVQVAKHFGSDEAIVAANNVEKYLTIYKTIEAEDNAKEEIISNLTDEQEEKLKEAHAEDYIGTDDDMPDAYEQWLEDATSEELKAALK